MPRAATCRSTISPRRCAYSRSLGDVAKELLERLESRDRVVMGEIEVQRRDGHESVLHRFEVRSLPRLPRRLLAADPVVLPPARVEALDHSFRIDAFSETRDSHSSKLSDRKVDVEDDAGVSRLLEQMLGELGGKFGAAVERHVLADERRERDRGDVEQRAFE